jgi:menaquinone-9 beta-reductase
MNQHRFQHAAYDVAIAGGSFAGLAVALQLTGRVLLIDHRPIGEGQTSACGTTVSSLRALDALETVQQTHDELVLHLTPEGRNTGATLGSVTDQDASLPSRRAKLPLWSGDERILRYRLPFQFCTFDYRTLCRLLAERAQARGVEVVQARALGWKDGLLLTDRGEVRTTCVVDATGWRATVARSVDPSYVRREHLSCGLEAELPQPAGNQAQGLHFWAGLGTVWPGYAWSFPCGPRARLGVIVYEQAALGALGKRTDESANNGSRSVPSSSLAGGMSGGLREALDAFLDGPGAPYWSDDGDAAWRAGTGAPTAGKHLHGGFLPAAPRRPVVGEVFTVGDAAGRCFALTGEGIRPALADAIVCGQLLQATIEGQLTPNQARARYLRHARFRVPYWHLMRLLQHVVSRMTDRGLVWYSRMAYPPPLFRFLMGQYLWPANPAAPLGPFLPGATARAF